ncbi:glucose-6-phosphate dehydrogenase [Georgenia sp. TF02-10]|uniref:glucose-6-phosphate dehydrogenase n=1 Tax=Georgenia sp. TF02-10 TaxID=2917725 RepID=UPI001FA752CD|nr:glucose-6-phosphate dehydrogenase [Georgenia sp. TF02-10]UNX56203.1 glucose-6-phosphate dehydrogenase [Georgenia sp. TF02-10]
MTETLPGAAAAGRPATPGAPTGTGTTAAPGTPGGSGAPGTAGSPAVAGAGPAANPLRDPRDRRLPRIAGPAGLVIFGVTGDLAKRKLMPAIYDLANRGLLPPSFALTGFGRRSWSQEEFAGVVHDAVRRYARTPFDERTWDQLASGFRFVQGEFDDDAAFDRLAETVHQLDVERGTGGNHAFYLSVPPDAFPRVLRQLDRSGLSSGGGEGWRRVVIEKPFGHDLASARELDAVVSEVFPPDAVFRIDHYLGKETVQNLLALRFANQLFEPIWNAHYVDHVQITMAEDIGIGTRAGYYDGIGAARDVIQNHLLQLLALTAMEEPVSFSADALRAEKEKVLSAVRLPADLAAHTARGQYAAGWQGGAYVQGYLQEEGIDPASGTETYAALRLDVQTRRWAGVPFYLRTGKRLGRRVTEIAVVFDRAPHLPFDLGATQQLGQNALVIRVQPDEGVTIRFGAKVPGTAMEVRDVTMDFGYGHAFTENSPEAYERLILDVLLGDPPLFPRQQEVELSWQILDPVIEAWAAEGRPEPYPPGTWGPASADAMLARDGRTWRRP